MTPSVLLTELTVQLSVSLTSTESPVCWCKKKFNIWVVSCKTPKNQFWSFWEDQRSQTSLSSSWTCSTSLMKWSLEVAWVTHSFNKSLDTSWVSPESCCLKIRDCCTMLSKRPRAKELRCTSPVTVSLPGKWNPMLKPKDSSSPRDSMLTLKALISDQTQEPDSEKSSREPTQSSGTAPSVYSRSHNSETAARPWWDTSSTEPRKAPAQSWAAVTQSAWLTHSGKRTNSPSSQPVEEPVSNSCKETRCPVLKVSVTSANSSDNYLPVLFRLFFLIKQYKSELNSIST